VVSKKPKAVQVRMRCWVMTSADPNTDEQPSVREALVRSEERRRPSFVLGEASLDRKGVLKRVRASENPPTVRRVLKCG
jgi:hypothetical protein